MSTTKDIRTNVILLHQSNWKNQPSKGLVFIGIIAVLSLLLEYVLDDIFRLDINAKTDIHHVVFCLVVAFRVFSRGIPR